MIGFIGAGAMGGAIIRGAIASGNFSADDVVVSGSSPEAAAASAQALGVSAAGSNADLVAKVGAGIVVLAVKPQVLPHVLPGIREEAGKQGTVIVSIAAGTTLETLASFMEPGQPIVRVMPNVAASIRESMTALCPNEFVSQEQEAEVARLFESVGQVATVAEKDFSIFSAIAGCSPAYTFTYIDAMARAGVKNGLRKDAAVRMAAQAVLGAAQMVLDDLSTTPMTLADSVQSPGGTTVAGIVALEEAGFGAAIVKGVQASVDKDIALQGK